MTPIEQVAGLVHLAFALGTLWALFFLLKAYRVEALRDRLFAVRQELFDYARLGGVEFSDPAYATLRQLMNSLIRFAHQLTFFRVGLGSAWVSDDPSPALEEWKQAVSKLPPEHQEKLEEIHAKALRLVVRHLVTGSPFAIVVGLFLVVSSMVHGATKSFLALLAERMPGLDSFQSQAITADSLDRKALHRGAAPA